MLPVLLRWLERSRGRSTVQLRQLWHGLSDRDAVLAAATRGRPELELAARIAVAQDHHALPRREVAPRLPVRAPEALLALEVGATVAPTVIDELLCAHAVPALLPLLLERLASSKSAPLATLIEATIARVERSPAPGDLERALAFPGPLLAVVHGTVAVYRVGPDEARLLARGPETESIRRGLARVRRGASDRDGPMVWTRDGDFTVWSRYERLAHGSARWRELASGRVRTDSVERVLSFLDEGDRGHRGVKLLLRNGAEAVVAEERDRTAQLDPTYGLDNVVIDAAWATFLGRDLAAWLGVPHEDELP